MADIRAQAVSRLATRLAGSAGQDVVYRRGADQAEMVGTLTDPTGTTRAALLGAAGGLDLSGLNLIVRAEDLVLGGERIDPRPGDKVEADFGGDTHVFAVRQEIGETAWRYSDPLRTLVRIKLTHLGPKP